MAQVRFVIISNNVNIVVFEINMFCIISDIIFYGLGYFKIIDFIYWNAVSKDSYLHWDNVFFCLFNLFVSKWDCGMRVRIETDQIFQTVIFIIRWIFVGWRQSRTLYVICKHLLRLISAFEKIIYTHTNISISIMIILRYK